MKFRKGLSALCARFDVLFDVLFGVFFVAVVSVVVVLCDSPLYVMVGCPVLSGVVVVLYFIPKRGCG
jgi:hypothetical protein